MQAFTEFEGVVAPFDRPNIDTDAIIPKQYLKSIHRTGFGPFLFDDWRYQDPGDLDIDPATRRPNPEFVLNQLRYQGAQILLARENFGCGSSREHAVWALMDYGFRVVIASSYADIFFNNSFKSGLLPVILDKSIVDGLFQQTLAAQTYRLRIDLRDQTVHEPSGRTHHFVIDQDRKHRLLNGLDDIGLTLREAAKIRAYEARRSQETPWLFPDTAQGEK